MYNVRFIYVSPPLCQDKRGRARLFAHQIRKFKRRACARPWMLKCPTCIGERHSVLKKQSHTKLNKELLCCCLISSSSSSVVSRHFVFLLSCRKSFVDTTSTKLHHCTLPFYLTISSLLWLHSVSKIRFTFLYLVSMTAISSSTKVQQFYHKQPLKGLSEYQPSPPPHRHIGQEVKQETLGAREPKVLLQRMRKDV